MLVYIKHVGKNLAYVIPIDAVDPGFGVGLPGGGGGVDPDWGVDGGEHPGHELPGGGRPPHISNRPPGSYPGRPGHLPARPGSPGSPGNELPEVPPPTLLPGYTLVMVRGPGGTWKYAAVKPGVAPPIVLPEPIPPGGAPDQGLPPQPPQPDQGGPSPTPSPKA